MSREAMQQALEALESDPISHAGLVSRKQAITALRQALVDADDTSQKRVDEKAKREQEPVAWITQGGKGWLRWHNKNDDHLNKTSVPLYKHPKRKPLSDAEIALISAECSLRTPSDIYFARAIEAAHGIKEKNNG